MIISSVIYIKMSAWKTQFYDKYVKPYEKYEIIAADKIKKYTIKK